MGLVFDRWTAGTPLRPLGTPDISPWRWVQGGLAAGPSWGELGVQSRGVLWRTILCCLEAGGTGRGRRAPTLWNGCGVCPLCFLYRVEGKEERKQVKGAWGGFQMRASASVGPLWAELGLGQWGVTGGISKAPLPQHGRPAVRGALGRHHGAWEDGVAVVWVRVEGSSGRVMPGHPRTHPQTRQLAQAVVGTWADGVLGPHWPQLKSQHGFAQEEA